MSVLGSAALLLAGCADSPARAQVVLYVDLDMPLSTQTGSDLSPDSSVDTLRIEIYRPGFQLVATRMFVDVEPEELPLSLGIASEVSPEGRVLVRIRAFRALFATPGVLAGASVLDPIREATVDRLVALDLPGEGVVPKSVTLHGDCMGTFVHFGVAGGLDRTCVDADQPDVVASEGVAQAPAGATAAGTWSRAAEVACSATPAAGTLCIPGGLTILGDSRLAPLVEEQTTEDSLPLRVAVLDPFYLDTTEVTVGELRDLVAHGYAGPLPDAPDASDDDRKFCTWDPGSNAALPLSCLVPATADAICAAKGGHVPSEAQWEHAARGRGERLVYPWGDSSPDCCAASIARVLGGGCAISGPEPVGSHQERGEFCAYRTSNPVDVSRDGVVDLAGSVSELMLDSVASFADPCWSSAGPTAILQDPVCTGGTGRIARGGAFAMAFGDAALPIRRTFVASDAIYGFRCAYDDAP